MENFIKRMRHYVELDDDDFAPLRALASTEHHYAAGQLLVAFEEKVEDLFIIDSGWALRTRYLEDGRRQVINVMLAGDYFDLMTLVGAKSDHSVTAATDVTLHVIRGEDFIRTIHNSPRLASAFWWVTVREEAALRQQIVRIGRMNAQERIANFILELGQRQDISRDTRDDFVTLPLPQSILADALGLSIVHVSRSLSAMKSRGLIRTSRRGVEILEREKLIELAAFEPTHPHPTRLAMAAQ